MKPFRSSKRCSLTVLDSDALGKVNHADSVLARALTDRFLTDSLVLGLPSAKLFRRPAVGREALT